ncbi:MAG: amidohydrolase family protein, partial [Clostridia bacterium]|nr:amidohydrolase family protein [Clostridia bacterium]
GRHLPPELIKMILKIKGPDRVIAVTDSLSVAGSDIKSGTMCGTDFIIEEGVARLPDRSAFVGSIATGDILVRTLVRDCGLALPEAIRLVSANPARLLGLGKGEIREGFDADLAVFDNFFDVSDVFVAGKRVSGR